MKTDIVEEEESKLMNKIKIGSIGRKGLESTGSRMGSTDGTEIFTNKS